MTASTDIRSRGEALPAKDRGARDAPPPLADLYESVLALRDEVVSTGAATMALWRDSIHREGFRPGAQNLANYLALRRHDLSELQPCLSAYGLSSLGRSQARVRTALDTLIVTLARLSELAKPDYQPLLRVSDGERALREEQDRILGRDPGGAKSLVMVTLPTEAASDREFVRRLLTAGANCVRINCAHDNKKIWADMIGLVRSVAGELARDCRVLMDIAGPKCRIESVHGPEKVRLRRGAINPRKRLFSVLFVRGAISLSRQMGRPFKNRRGNADSGVARGGAQLDPNSSSQFFRVCGPLRRESANPCRSRLDSDGQREPASKSRA